MRRLLFSVDGQHIAKQGDFSGITAGSKGYLKHWSALRLC